MSNLFTDLTRAKKDQQEKLEQQYISNTATVSPKTPQKNKGEQRTRYRKKVEEVQQLNNSMVLRHHDTVIPRYHDTTIESVRKAVKLFGKEAATHRFTIEEKQFMTEMIYLFRQQGIRTSENEITRIAINFLVKDYKINGEESVLDKVLRALND